MKAKSFITAMMIMASTMASAQKYVNVELKDGTIHSYSVEVTEKVSFGEKKGTEVAESEQTVTVNGHKVTVKLAEDIPANDVAINVYSEEGTVKIKAVSVTNKPLRCTRDDNAEVPAPDVANGLHTFSISGISQDVVAIVEYDQFTVHFDLLSHGGTAPEDISVMRGAVINVTPTANDGYEFRGWYMEPSCIAGTEWSWDKIKANKTDDITLYAKWVTKINGHDCVKLGGIYWATENVTGSKDGYSYIWHDDTYGDYYTQANDNALNAAKSWGNESGHTWTLPSESQFDALMNNCTWTWKSSYPYNGKNVAGMFVTGKKENGEEGHSLFLPAAGIYNDGGIDVHGQGGLGFYWSACNEGHLNFSLVSRSMDDDTPHNGMAVRPVSE